MPMGVSRLSARTKKRTWTPRLHAKGEYSRQWKSRTASRAQARAMRKFRCITLLGYGLKPGSRRWRLADMNAEDQYLLVRRAGAEPERIGLNPAAVCTLGRSQSSTVFLNDVSISRQHAQVTFRDGSFWIEDLGSKNGTKVGGRRIDGATALKQGDAIQLGSVHLVFSGNEPSSSGSARVADI